MKLKIDLTHAGSIVYSTTKRFSSLADAHELARGMRGAWAARAGIEPASVRVVVSIV